MSNYSKTTDFAAKDSLPTGDSGKIIRGSEFETEFDAISTAIATKADTAGPTFTGTLTFETISDGTINVTAFVDEDNMASNSATLVPTQQSVKAYVDSQLTAQDLDFQADSGGALSIDLDSETMTFTGGTGIDTSGSGNAVTFAIDSTVATLTGTQTLTNKTLTSPVLNTGVSGTAVLDEDDMASNSATQLATQQSIKAYVNSQVAANNELSEILANGNTTGGANILFGDSASVSDDRLVFGAGSDLQIYHDGSDSYIQDSGAGDLRLKSNGSGVKIEDAGNTLAFFDTANNNAKLYHNNNQKLESTGTGIDVTGTVTADGLTVTDSSSALLSLMEGGSSGADLEFVGATNTFVISTGAGGAGSQTPRISIGRDTGDISFFEDTGTNAKLFFDASAERLGIGTTSPEGALSVSNGGAEGVEIDFTGGTMRIVSFDRTAVADSPLEYRASEHVFKVSTSRKASINSSGNLLVGTTSVLSDGKISVAGGASANGITATTAATSGFAAASFQRTASDGQLIQFKKGSAEVGDIGTRDGDIYIGTGDTTVIFSDSADAVVPRGSDGALRDAAISLGNTSNRFKDVHLSGDLVLTNSFVFGNTDGLNLRANSGKVISMQIAGSEKVRVNASGNVGIGETNPNTALHVTATDSILKLDGTTSARVQFMESDTTDKNFTLTLNNGTFLLNEVTDSGSFVSTPFKIEGGAAGNSLVVNSSGNVGIGTASPSSNLEVKGSTATSNKGATVLINDSAALAANVGGAVAFMGTDGTDDRTYGLIKGGKFNATAGAFDGYLSFQTRTNGQANTTERMRLTSGGLVGIGTNSPSSLLHVASDGEAKVIIQGDVNNDVGEEAALLEFISDGNAVHHVIGQEQGSINDLSIMAGEGALTTIACSLVFKTKPTGTTTSVEAMRIDSNRNLLVGTTSSTLSSSSSATGVNLKPNGASAIVRDGGTVFYLNRLTSDGAIADFRKDGTSVGSIGSFASDITLGKAACGLRFEDGTQTIRPHSLTTNSSNDGNVTLGNTDSRFEDLYLSGGVFLGGTATANKLDDYEEGTFTPSFNGGDYTFTYNKQKGSYTKIGNRVFVDMMLNIDASTAPSGSTDGNLFVAGLPFTFNAQNSVDILAVSIGFKQEILNAEDSLSIRFVSGNTQFSIHKDLSTGFPDTTLLQASDLAANSRLRIQFSYPTNS